MSCIPRRGLLAAVSSLCLALAACGGGTSTKYSGSTVSGTVLMDANSPVAGGSNVCLYAIANGQGNPLNTSVSPPTNTGTLLTSGCITSDALGHFSQALPNFYGPVLVQITNGTYYNHAAASGTTLNNLSATNASLQAVVMVGGGGTVNVVVSPLTTIATAMALAMPGGLSMSNYAAAAARVATEFQLGNTDVTAAAPSAGDAQDLVLLGIEQYLVSVVSDTNGSNLLNWNTTALSSMSTDFTTSYDTINSSTTTFTFN